MKEFDLERTRNEIDALDRQLAEVLHKRLDLVINIAKWKKRMGIPVKDVKREKEIIAKVANFVDIPDYTIAVKNIMRGVIDQSCLLEDIVLANTQEKAYEIGCFGPEGSFTHQALEDYFQKHRYNRHHFNTFDEVVIELCRGNLDYAVLPIENSSTGGITEVYDLLRKYNCCIVGEQQVKIEQNLVGIKDSKIDRITKVYSHPQAFKQSNEFLKKHPNIEQIPFFSTSKSAKEVAELKDPTVGAICGQKAAELYDLDILAPDINYNPNNYTRFVIISATPKLIPNANKITLVVGLKHEAGTLYKMLGSFCHTGLNLLNLESRPMDGRSWEYYFYIDVEGNLSDPLVIDMMDEIKAKCTYCKILGNYCAYERNR